MTLYLGGTAALDVVVRGIFHYKNGGNGHKVSPHLPATP